LNECGQPEQFRGWILQIARYQALNIRRYQAPRAAVALDAVPDPPSLTHATDASLMHDNTRVRQAMATLSPLQRAVVVHHEIDGWTHDQIARKTGLGVLMSRRHLSDARASLRKFLDPFFPRNEPMVEHRDGDHDRMHDHETDHQGAGVNAERRERVVDAVLQRIASAPPRGVVVALQPGPRVWADIDAWRVPALAAAVLVMMVSGALIAKSDQPLAQETPAGLSGPLPAPLARYLATGEVAPMEWLNTFAGRP